MPAEAVAELIDRIMVARYGGVEPGIANAWKTEAERRIAELKLEKSKVFPFGKRSRAHAK